MADRRTIAVVDGNSLMHRAFHALPETMTAPDGRPTNAAFGFVSMLLKLHAELRPDGVVVAFDKGRPAFRIEALEQYKVHRPPTAETLKAQFPMVKSLLEAMAVPVVELEGWEGDDILGTLARRGGELGMRVLLVTGDRDAYQLVSEDVAVVTTKKGITDITLVGPAQVVERYGIQPSQVIDYLGLKGDTSDNIPGVPGVGEKTAAKLLQEYGSMEAVLEAAAAGAIKGKVGENIAANRELALASRAVATISREVPVDVDLESVKMGDFDASKVAHAFGELRFTSLLDKVLALKGGASAVAASTSATASHEHGAAAPDVPADAGSELSVHRGSRAMEAVRGWAASQGEEAAVLGAAVGVTDESLFGNARVVAVACGDEVALFDADDFEHGLSAVLTAQAVAAGDCKELIEQLCPADQGLACSRQPADEDASRLFDCGIAAYLLESSRSSYALEGLYADFLDAVPPVASEALPSVAIEALCAASLAPALRSRLDADGSGGVFADIEMPLIPVLARMERCGVGVDTGVLQALGEETRAGIAALRAKIYELAGEEFVVDSPKQLSAVLFEKLGLPPQKKTKTGLSTDASVLAALAPLHPIADKIVAYRELTKLTSTYIDALPRMLGSDGRLHTSFNQTVAATGRLSSSNPNLQNIPVRTELGRRIRAAFVPGRPGDVMVSADYSQIELRILAHLAQDAGLIEAFTSGEDFHTATAARVFGVAPADVDPGMRAKAKAVNFGIVYGQSAHGLGDSLKIGYAEAQEMIDRYYAAYPGVRRYLDETVAQAHQDGFATTMFGRKRRIPELRSSNYNLRSFGERTAMNHPMQGSAADIMKLAMIEMDRVLRASQMQTIMVLQVHDELVFEVPAGEVEQVTGLVKQAMGGVVDIGVPLDVSVGSGPNWADAK